MTDNQNNNKPKKRSVRSRKHPYVSLPEAVEKIEELAAVDKFHPIPIEVAFSAWDYSSSSSTAYRVASAVLQYGLADDTGSGDDRHLQLTDRARIILGSPHEHERRQAIREAALLPDIHSELWDPRKGLPARDSIRWKLIKDGDINESRVDDFLDNLERTIEYAKLSPENMQSFFNSGIFGDKEEAKDKPRDPSNSESGIGGRAETTPNKREISMSATTSSADLFEVPFGLPGGKRIILLMPSGLSGSIIEHARKKIDSYLDDEAATANLEAELKRKGDE